MRLSPRVWKILRSRRTKVLLACSPFVLITLVALAYPVSAWWGRRSVDRFVESMQNKGYVIHAETYFSSESPGENFFLHPAMLAEDSGSLVRALRNLEPPPPGLSRRPDNGEPHLGRRADIRSWLKPSPSDEKEAASILLAAVEPSSQRLDELRGALKLPRADWPLKGPLGSGEEAIQNIVRSQLRLRPIADFAADEAYLHLVLGGNDRAAANIDAMLDCQRLYLSSKPTLASLFLSEVLLAKTGNLIWEGIARSSWTDAHLATFDSTLARADTQAALVFAFRGEAALLEVWAEKVRALKRPDQGVNFSDGWEADTKVIQGRLLGIWCELRPAGITMSNHVESQRILFNEATLANGNPRNRFEPEDLARFGSAKDGYTEVIIASDGGGTHHSLDADAQGWSTLTYIATTALRAEARIALNRTGIALERYRLKHDRHPASLEELVPAFLSAVPTDPFTRQALHYRLLPDGSPHVWSLGPNLTDEGGLPKRDRTQGDLVWITRPIPGYTEKDYRKP